MYVYVCGYIFWLFWIENIVEKKIVYFSIGENEMMREF